MKQAQTILNQAILTKLFIITLDLLLCQFAFVAAVLLRFNLEVPADVLQRIPLTLLIFLITRAAAFYFFKTYSGIIRYAGMHDVMRIMVAVGLSDFAVLLIYWSDILPDMYYAYSVAIINTVITLLLLGYRFLLVIFYRYVKRSLQSSQKKVNVIIYGAGNWGIATKRTIENDALFNYRVAAFFDNDPAVAYKLLDGIKVLCNREELQQTIRKFNVRKVIIAQNNITTQHQAFINECLQTGIQILKIPPVHLWTGDGFQTQQLQQLNIEDLLEREPIVLHSAHVKQYIHGQKVLVTGAAGSIGRELVRQITSFNPSQLIILDKSESALHELHLEIRENLFFDEVIPVLADVSSFARMEEVFMKYRPDIIYHAAAYKHVPMLELHPGEAVKNNIMGTKTVADLAVKYKTKRFVMVSTDKAVKPTSVMGASKRMAEMYVQALNMHSSNTCTQFIVTRFGNVLGSDGSVIPRFKKQIEAGGPVTVTSPEITRYFMTIPEACQLILEASTMGEAGQIFIFDMGKPVKILDLAVKMIRLAGFEPDKDIPVQFTGLRPREKLTEELFTDTEKTTKTYHPKIMICRDEINYNYENIIGYINALQQSLKNRDTMEIVRIMKNAIPDYISNNSVYQQLDKEIVRT